MNGLVHTRAALRSISRSCRSLHAGHTRKELPYPLENGLGDFLPPAALKTIAVEYQQGLLDRLSDEIKGTSVSRVKSIFVHVRAVTNKSVAQTVIDTAPDRTKTLAFNYASQALNNSFFLDSLVRRYTLLPVPR